MRDCDVADRPIATDDGQQQDVGLWGGSRVNREVHARIWERPGVRFLRATRPSATSLDVRFSNRPFGVKHFQTIHRRMSMLLAGSRFSSESAPRPLYGAFLVKKFK